jgi:hypothetical protein
MKKDGDFTSLFLKNAVKNNSCFPIHFMDAGIQKSNPPSKPLPTRTANIVEIDP